MEKHPPVRFVDRSTDGFGFDDDAKLFWPVHYDGGVSHLSDVPSGRQACRPLVDADLAATKPHLHPLNPYGPADAYNPIQGISLGDSDMYFNPDAFIPVPPAEETVASP